MTTHSSSSSSTTITTAKSTFLRTQIRLLSSPLHLSSSTSSSSSSHHPSLISTTTSSQDEEPILPPKTLDEILTKVDAKIKSHNRLVFSVQSQRHVAEQIDALYWAEINEEEEEGVGGGIGGEATEVVYVSRDTDLGEMAGIALLGGDDEEDQRGLSEIMVGGGNRGKEGEEGGDEDRESRYRELKTELIHKAKRRDELRARVGGYRGLRKVLAAFEEVGVGVQPNLVTKGGELEVELERLKVLVARVVAGMGKSGMDGGMGVLEEKGRGEQHAAVSERQRLQRVMDLD